MRRAALFFFFVLIAPTVHATTYYISAIGADTNNGTTKGTSWLHAPGMTNCSNTCASTTPVAGDSIIFRGGDTWHFGNSGAAPYVGAKNGWTWSWSGSAGNVIYVGVDQTWYTGGSWTRPIMTGDNALWSGSGYPSSCTYDFGTAGQMIELAASYITFDNFEGVGVCYSGAGGINFFDQSQSGSGFHHLILTNHYFHGWNLPSSASGAVTFFNSLGSLAGGEQTNVISNNVVDGFDSPHFATGANCTASADPCASGQAIYGWAWDVHANVFRYLMDVAVTLNTSLWHDNLSEYLYTAWSTAAVNNQHSNIMNNLGGATGESMFWYNNIMRNTYVTEDLYFGVRTNLYFFNNVMYNNMNNSTFGGIGAGGCLRLNNVSNSAASTTAYIYNNTTDYSCQFKFEVANSPLTKWNGVGNFENNHFINFSPASLSSVYICSTSGTCTINDNGHEIYQTFAVANAQGYTTGNAYAPTLMSNATVGAGANLTSSCATFSPDSALCSGTSGTMEASGSGGQIAVTPGITLVPRPGSGPWNSGGYEFAAAAGGGGVTFSPGVVINLGVTVR